VETIVSLGLLVMLLGGYAMFQASAARANGLMLARQACLLAAEAQLDSVAATGRALAADEAISLWPGVRVSVRREAGRGQWQGFTLVRAVAETRRLGASQRVELSRYVATQGTGP
jgi:hypothetical protein